MLGQGLGQSLIRTVAAVDKAHNCIPDVAICFEPAAHLDEAAEGSQRVEELLSSSESDPCDAGRSKWRCPVPEISNALVGWKQTECIESNCLP